MFINVFIDFESLYFKALKLPLTINLWTVKLGIDNLILQILKPIMNNLPHST